MNPLRKILDLLSPQERRRALLLLVLILVMTLLDMLGVVSIMPFMSVLSNPEVIQTNAYLKAIYYALGFTDSRKFLFFLGMVVFVLLVVSIIFKALTTWALLRFTSMREYTLGRRLAEGYLRQPYEWFLQRHSADLGKSVLSEVGQVTNGSIIPLMQLIVKSVVTISLLGVLVLVEPSLALYVGVGLGVTYGAIFFLVRKTLTRLGKARVNSNKRRFHVLTEAFGGIKDVKVSGLETVFLHRFEGPAQQYAANTAKAQVIKVLPRFVIEAVAFGGMILVLLYLMQSERGLQDALPIAALYAVAGYRLMPALQEVYVSLSSLRFSGPALDNLHKDLMQLPAATEQTGQELLQLAAPTYELELRDVTYQYPSGSRPALSGLNLVVRARTTVGLVGITGSGKTTAADLILGLLVPAQGELRVDGQVIDAANRRAWQRAIGYVPQQIFLTDDTLAANIAFGVPREKIDWPALEQAARIANLHAFVTQELPKGYDTEVGERGVRLSGGQRQRIGIARALYHQPRVLVLDEATSALDNLTEQAVMEAVHNLSHEITIILIAHRLSTLRECDQIYLMDKGQIAAQGSYEELAAGNVQFHLMANAGKN
jgi:ABC-type bacteriocin/lantibiotic exporter with double-glycine peptidase domain